MNVAEASVDQVPAMLRAGVSGALGVCAGAEGVVGLEQADRPPAMRTTMRITTRGPKPWVTNLRIANVSVEFAAGRCR
jgi:hypothetical protein